MPRSRTNFYIPSVVDGAPEQITPIEDPNLLNGELVVRKLDKVKKYLESNAGLNGILYCTTYRLSFVSYVTDSEDESQHKFLTGNDIPLSNILSVVVTGNKTKRITKDKLSGSYHIIKIHTKDCRILTFELPMSSDRKEKSARKDVGVYCICIPKEINREVHEWLPPTYNSKQDWELELERLGADAIWRVDEGNEQFNHSISLSKYIVVPRSQSFNTKILSVAHAQYSGNRMPIWCYTHTSRCSLIASSVTCPETAHLGADEQYKLAVYKQINTHLQEDVELTKEIGTLSDIQQGYAKLLSLCSAGSGKEFIVTDNEVYKIMESSRWLYMISSSIRVASQISEQLQNGAGHVIVKEDQSKDLCCLVSCLVQLICDKSSRTIKGFQNLIQRCWVSAGHPFRDRLALMDSQTLTPVFLLFLDCVHQLTLQFPLSFEFSEVYLIAIWDGCLSGLYREFICNCDNEREDKTVYSSKGSTSSIRNTAPSASIWRWDLQYDSDYLLLFKNPMFQLPSISSEDIIKDLDFTQPPDILQPLYHPSQIEVWVGCYYRFSPSMQIAEGGKPAEYLRQCILVEEITDLLNKIKQRKTNEVHRQSGLMFNRGITTSEKKQMNLKWRTTVISSFPFINRMSRNVSDISIAAMLQKSLIFTQDADADDP